MDFKKLNITMHEKYIIHFFCNTFTSKLSKYYFLLNFFFMVMTSCYLKNNFSGKKKYKKGNTLI